MNDSLVRPESIVESHVTLVYVWGMGWALPGGRFTDLRSFAEALALKLNDMATGRIPGCPRIIGKSEEQTADERLTSIFDQRAVKGRA